MRKFHVSKKQNLSLNHLSHISHKPHKQLRLDIRKKYHAQLKTGEITEEDLKDKGLSYAQISRSQKSRTSSHLSHISHISHISHVSYISYIIYCHPTSEKNIMFNLKVEK